MLGSIDKERDDFIRTMVKNSKRGTSALLVEALLLPVPLSDLKTLTKSLIAQAIAIAQSSINDHKSGKTHVAVEKLTLDKSNAATLIEIVTDNKPFLVDSILSAIVEQGIEVRMVTHPIIPVATRRSGAIEKILPPEKSEASNLQVSLIQIVTEPLDTSARSALKKNLQAVMQAVSRSVSDWQPMLARVDKAIADFRSTPPSIPATEIAEAVQFLEWLRDENFTFLGVREYKYTGSNKKGELRRAGVPGLGILRDPKLSVVTVNGKTVTMTPAIREFLNGPDPLFISKANVKSVVHRRTYMDYIGVKLYDRKGKLSGELRLVGLFTSTAYTRSVKTIPMIRKKVDHVLSHSHYGVNSHSGKALLNILESYPRDELFQVNREILTEFSNAILQLGERPRVRVLPRLDKFGRFVSILVYVPRDRYNSDNRIKIGQLLAKIYDGRVSAFYPSFPEGQLARVHFIIGRNESKVASADATELEARINRLIQTWEDRLNVAGSAGGVSLDDYEQAFSAAYQEAFSEKDTLQDIAVIEQLTDDTPLSVNFHEISASHSKDDTARTALKIYHQGSALPLSERVPLLENMGFLVINERTYGVEPKGRDAIFIHDMLLKRADDKPLDLQVSAERLESCFLATWSSQNENDGYNALVLKTQLPWRDVAMLRVYSRYLRQIRIPYSQDYMWEVVCRHPETSAKLVHLFRTRFDPELFDGLKDAGKETGKRAKAQSDIIANIEADLEKIESQDDDSILRHFLDVIRASVRTNFFQTNERTKALGTLAFKVEPRKIAHMPDPKPYREIFLYSARVEGLHLRFGPVARGGLRWSDRAQDYRTEVLGLVKAQQVKNAVIVPVGSKGGFYPKKLPAAGSRDAVFEEGRNAYKIFIGTLLSLTDNLVNNKVVGPKQTLRHDGDDPYFVVAADKGTSTFSDTANGISREYDFWLDDAFASGGSAGYDHKAMGITARGGWEAVKRHFREMNRDIQSEPFTVVGVGDMSGDVFGNGMLLSPKIHLIAAFDHRDIFIDPNPDEKISFAERKRLFNGGRTSWQDYNASKISKGGGVFSRKEKSITLSKAASEAIGLTKNKATPQEIMNAILKAQVDLLWFGGIGTYIRATTESDVDAGDRANDSIRITAKEVGAKVIGEGANLGMTQPARIEYNMMGGRSNSDAIDNSAGVNSSDVEVNIKIALASALRSGKLTLPKRNKLLEAMTEEVAELVLRNNYLQTLAISMTERKKMEDFAYQARFMQGLEQRGLLDRAVEDLPDDTALAEREVAQSSLTRAEIGVLLAYAKIVLLDDLVASEVPDAPYLHKELVRYFPTKMRKTYAAEIDGHRLNREIIATVVSNAMINRGGPTYLTRVADQTGASMADIARAYIAVRDVFGLQEINAAIDALDNKVEGDVQMALYTRVQNLLLDRTVWFLRNISFKNGIDDVVATYSKTLAQLRPKINSKLPPYMINVVESDTVKFTEQGVPKKLAAQIASLTEIALVPDIHVVAESTGLDLNKSANIFFKVTEAFRIGRIIRAARALPTDDYYDGLALSRATQILLEARRQIAIDAIKMKKPEITSADAVDHWINAKKSAVKKTQNSVIAITEADQLTVSRLTVAANLLADLTRK